MAPNEPNDPHSFGPTHCRFEARTGPSCWPPCLHTPCPPTVSAVGNKAASDQTCKVGNAFVHPSTVVLGALQDFVTVLFHNNPQDSRLLNQLFEFARQSLVQAVLLIRQVFFRQHVSIDLQKNNLARSEECVLSSLCTAATSGLKRVELRDHLQNLLPELIEVIR